MRYKKLPLADDDHIALLEKERGLVIENYDRAKRYLQNAGYFRLTGYMYHLQKDDGSHVFEQGTTFNHIIDTYQFDKKLRYLLAEYLERIEVATRSLVSNAYSLKHGFYWYMESTHFEKPKIPEGRSTEKVLDVHNYINTIIKEYYEKATEQYLKNFKYKYTSESCPPSNMAMEILSMGQLAKLLVALKKKDAEVQKVGQAFKLPIQILSSWFIYLANVRNICAHHSRLWNKKVTADRFTIPKLNYAFHGNLPSDFNTTVYGILSIMVRLLNSINPENSLISKFQQLIKEYPNIDLSQMGFPSDWMENPAWKEQ